MVLSQKYTKLYLHGKSKVINIVYGIFLKEGRNAKESI